MKICKCKTYIFNGWDIYINGEVHIFMMEYIYIYLYIMKGKAYDKERLKSFFKVAKAWVK